MSAIIAFDSKDFKRVKNGKFIFYSPLGCGVKISKTEEFHETYTTKMNNLLKAFGVSPVCACLASSEFFPTVGFSKTYKISDELLRSVQHLIDTVFISYIILPSKTIPTVEVCGYRSAKIAIPTFNFLRNTSAYFSYLTAWGYLHNGYFDKKDKMLVDGFRGKITYAWEELQAETSPIVYPHGDECNVYIATADMIASLTDKKLYDNYLRLTPKEITSVWEEYSFKVEVRFLDANIISQIKWNSNEEIKTANFHAKPTIFLKADGYNTSDIKKLSVYPDATMLACQMNGCLQGFDKKMDSDKIRDGDVFVYAGKESEESAMTLKDIYDIHAIPFKELKQKVKRP